MLNTEKPNKSKLNRHIKAHIKQTKSIKQELKQEENKDKAQNLYLQTLAPQLDFDRFPSVNLVKTKSKSISKPLKLED